MTGKRTAAVLWTAALLLVLCGAAVLRTKAAGYGASLVIPVSVEFDGRCPAGASSEILVWSSDDSRFTTPVRIPVSGGGTVYFGPAEYLAPGSYHYHVIQRSGGSALVDYDSAEYEVTAGVLNGSNGRLLVNPVYRKKGSSGKSGAIRFVNRGRTEVSPAPVPAGTRQAASPQGLSAQGAVPASVVLPAERRFIPAATGDSAAAPGWLAGMMCASGAGLAAIARYSRKQARSTGT